MNDEWNDEEAVHITSDSADELQFFQRILDDPSILESIPEGATITILPTRPSEQSGLTRQAEVAARSINSFEVGDQTVYILAVKAKGHAAD